MLVCTGSKYDISSWICATTAPRTLGCWRFMGSFFCGEKSHSIACEGCNSRYSHYSCELSVLLFFSASTRLLQSLAFSLPSGFARRGRTLMSRKSECAWFLHRYSNGVSQTRGPKYGSPNTIILIIGTPKKGTPNFGKALNPKNSPGFTWEACPCLARSSGWHGRERERETPQNRIYPHIASI